MTQLPGITYPRAGRSGWRMGLAGLLAALLAACGQEGTPDHATRTPNPTDGGAGARVTYTAPVATATQGPATPTQLEASLARKGRLQARPAKVAHDGAAGASGLQPLGIGARRDGLLYVPAGYSAGTAAPLVVVLHGAGGDARQGIGLLQALADEHNILLLSPDSRETTWDFIGGGYGPDVLFVDGALAQVFDRYDVDPGRLAIGGFSDGASYALSLGLSNGDLFTHVLAFSPGFMAPAQLEGEPRIYISHGTRDAVLPIDRCSRRIVPRLEQSGYEVNYHEFDGPHTVPPDIARQAVSWFLGAER